MKCFVMLGNGYITWIKQIWKMWKFKQLKEVKVTLCVDICTWNAFQTVSQHFNEHWTLKYGADWVLNKTLCCTKNSKTPPLTHNFQVIAKIFQAWPFTCKQPYLYIHYSIATKFSWNIQMSNPCYPTKCNGLLPLGVATPVWCIFME